MNRLCDLLNIQHPLIQAPMAGGITSPQLVAAVSKAGALGAFGAAYMTPDQLRDAVREVKAQTALPFQVNLFVPDTAEAEIPSGPAYEVLRGIYARYGLDIDAAPKRQNEFYHGHIDAVLQEQVPVVTFTFGVPAPDIVRKLKQAGCVLGGTATCLAEAKEVEAAGLDFVAAQGCEAGGHRATFHETLRRAPEIPNIGLFSLLQHLTSNLAIPVVASGGIMNGRGMAAAMMLGAAGCQLGTAFMGCPEATVTASWRAALEQAADAATTLTRSFSGRAARGIRNGFIAQMAAVENSVASFAVQNALTGPLRRKAKEKDDSDYQSLWAGQASAFLRRMPAAELVAVLMQELDAAFRAAPELRAAR